jgi:hypothetical protein
VQLIGDVEVERRVQRIDRRRDRRVVELDHPVGARREQQRRTRRGRHHAAERQEVIEAIGRVGEEVAAQVDRLRAGGWSARPSRCRRRAARPR